MDVFWGYISYFSHFSYKIPYKRQPKGEGGGFILAHGLRVQPGREGMVVGAAFDCGGRNMRLLVTSRSFRKQRGSKKQGCDVHLKTCPVEIHLIQLVSTS